MFRYSELGPQFQIFSKCMFKPSMIKSKKLHICQGGLVKDLLLFIMLITALNLLFSELHSSVICATKFYSEMLPIKSTCSYVLSERSMALIFWAAANH